MVRDTSGILASNSAQPCPHQLPAGMSPLGPAGSQAAGGLGPPVQRPTALPQTTSSGQAVGDPPPPARAQARASPEFRDIVFLRVPQGRDPGLGGPVHGRPVREGRGGRAGAGGTGTRCVQRWRLPPEEPARCLPPRPRGGAAPSRFSQLLPTPPTAGRGWEGATLFRGWGGEESRWTHLRNLPNGQGQSLRGHSNFRVEPSGLLVPGIPTRSLACKCDEKLISSQSSFIHPFIYSFKKYLLRGA